jgi:hypothetical protein
LKQTTYAIECLLQQQVAAFKPLGYVQNTLVDRTKAPLRKPSVTSHDGPLFRIRHRNDGRVSRVRVIRNRLDVGQSNAAQQSDYPAPKVVFTKEPHRLLFVFNQMKVAYQRRKSQAMFNVRFRDA